MKSKWFLCQNVFLRFAFFVQANLTRENFETETRELCSKPWRQSWVLRLGGVGFLHGQQNPWGVFWLTMNFLKMFKWFQNQFFIFPFLQFFPLMIDYIFATTALWRSGLCLEIKLSSYAFDVSNNKILLTFGSIFGEMLVLCWRCQDV